MKFVWIITLLLNNTAFKNAGGLKDKRLKYESPYSVTRFFTGLGFFYSICFQIPKQLKQISSVREAAKPNIL